jgi:hypothetical protein
MAGGGTGSPFPDWEKFRKSEVGIVFALDLEREAAVRIPDQAKKYQLNPEERAFVFSYYEDKKHSPASRKRFERLCDKLTAFLTAYGVFAAWKGIQQAAERKRQWRDEKEAGLPRDSG